MTHAENARINNLERFARVGGQAMTGHLNGKDGGRMRHWCNLVDPDGKLEPAERMRRAEAKQKAHLLRASVKAAEKRRAKRR